ncbi:PAS domain S-box protein [Puteibacter caeruleilacunae]|nr:PAS domain S-box protein [Puteibacter caeruleilacunae]
MSNTHSKKMGKVSNHSSAMLGYNKDLIRVLGEIQEPYIIFSVEDQVGAFFHDAQELFSLPPKYKDYTLDELVEILNVENLSDLLKEVWRTNGSKEVLINSADFESLSMKLVPLKSTMSVLMILSDRTYDDYEDEDFTVREQRFLNLIANFHGVAYRCQNDEDWTMEFISEGIYALTGYKPEEIRGNRLLSYNDLIHPDDRDIVKERVDEGIREHRQFTIEYRIIAKNGDVKWVWEQGVAVYNEEGTLTNLEGLINDITTQKEAVTALRDSEEKFKRLATQSPLAIYTTDANGDCNYVNPQWLSLAGMEIEDALGKGWIEAIHPDDREYISDMWYKSVNSRGKWGYEFRFKSKQGDIYWLYGTAAPVFNEHGDLISYLGTNIDITERKKAQLSVIKSEMKYRRLVQNSPDIAYIFSVKKGARFWANKIRDILGFEPDEMLRDPMAWVNAIHPDDQPMVYDLLENLKAGDTWDLEYRIYDAWNNIHWIRDRAFSVVEEGDDLVVEGLAADITRQKESEQELIRAKEKAEESDRLKSAFLANMSHEIRTPLNSIIGFSDLLVNTEISDEKAKQFMQLINSSGEQLLRIISDIIDISKIESNQLKILHSWMELNEVMIMHFESHKESNLYKSKDQVELKLTLPYNAQKLNLYTDPGRLKQILANLISNAIKYTDKGVVEVGYTLEQIGEKQRVRIFVKDTGVGIPENQQELIFERFCQLDKGYAQGTGLGLSITKGLVELLGGEITVQSDLNKGSCFSFTLPVPEISQQTKGTTSKMDASSEKIFDDRLIYIAEDDKNSLVYLEEILGSTSLEISYVNNGRELLELVHQRLPDAILLDINMPEINGLEVTQRIRREGIRIPIIAQTAHAMSEEQDRILNAGCTDYIAKPFTKDELIRKLKSVLT